VAPDQALIYSTLALLLSLVLPARRMAAMGSGLAMVASYLISFMTGSIEGLEASAQFLPYGYFQGGDALNGLKWTWFLGLPAVKTLLAWRRFRRRDIRVTGKGTWRRPSILAGA
jgi:hypothetical protein